MLRWNIVALLARTTVVKLYLRWNTVWLQLFHQSSRLLVNRTPPPCLFLFSLIFSLLPNLGFLQPWALLVSTNHIENLGEFGALWLHWKSFPHPRNFFFQFANLIAFEFMIVRLKFLEDVWNYFVTLSKFHSLMRVVCLGCSSSYVKLFCSIPRFDSQGPRTYFFKFD